MEVVDEALGSLVAVAAMLALAGAERLAEGLIDGLDAVARPRWPLDEAAALANPTHVAGRKGAKA